LLAESARDDAELGRRLFGSMRAAVSDERTDQGGVFVRNAAELSLDQQILLQAAAHVVLVGDGGSLADQLDRTDRRRPLLSPETMSQERVTCKDEPIQLPSNLLFSNGLGGFTPDGREYCILVSSEPLTSPTSNGTPKRQATPYPRLAPAPWVNVIANPGF